jgi:hypothetical protein
MLMLFSTFLTRGSFCTLAFQCLIERIYKSNYKASIGAKNIDWFYFYDDEIDFLEASEPGYKAGTSVWKW